LGELFYMETIAVHVQKDNTVMLCCPHCEFARIVQLARLKNVKHTFVVRCKCDNRFKVNLNIRKSYRKNTAIPGQVMVLFPKASTLFEMTVCDISRNGIGFKITEPANLHIDDILRVTFNLDNHKQTLIEKKVIIRGVRKDFIGCKFLELDLYDRELGFYLMP